MTLRTCSITHSSRPILYSVISAVLSYIRLLCVCRFCCFVSRDNACRQVTPINTPAISLSLCHVLLSKSRSVHSSHTHTHAAQRVQSTHGRIDYNSASLIRVNNVTKCQDEMTSVCIEHVTPLDHPSVDVLMHKLQLTVTVSPVTTTAS